MIKKIDDLQTEPDVLKSYVQIVQTAAPNLNSIVSSNMKPTIPEEEIMIELYETQDRMCNVMIFNMSEKGNDETCLL